MDKENVLYLYVQWNIIKSEKNEVLVFAATWMDLEIIILSGVPHRKEIIYDITYICNAKIMHIN